MYNAVISTKKYNRSRKVPVYRKKNVSMNELVDNIVRVLQATDFTDCKITISSNKNKWFFEQQRNLPFEETV